MSRSLYKPIYVHKSLFEDCLLNKEKNKKIHETQNLDKSKNIPRFLWFWTKASSLNNVLLDKKIAMYNGKVLITLNVTPKILGYKIGSFCITSRKPPHVGKQRQVKKVSRSHQKMVAERKRIVNRGKFKKK